MKQLAILGAGSWGTALAIALSSRFERIDVWAHDPEQAARLEESRTNAAYLPDAMLPRNIEVSHDISRVAAAADIVLLAIPSEHLRSVCRGAAPHVAPSAILVSAAKGIENGTLLRMTQVLGETFTNDKLAAVSGPTFAREIALGEPAALVVASQDEAVAKSIQTAFSTSKFRLYTNSDLIGVEIGAALKNVVAIGAGIVDGLGLGSNTLAALVTRGLAEIGRLAVAMGGQPATLAGLAGLGDLVLTCTGKLSRNRFVGVELAKGRTLGEILSSMKMVAEGVNTTEAAVNLASRYEIEMPITYEMYAILRKGKSPRDGIRQLMDRSLKSE